MAEEEKNISLTDAQAIGKAIGQEIGQQVVQAILEAQAINQQAGAASTMAELVNKIASSSSRDTDINAEEAMKSYSPIWGINAKIVLANEIAALINARSLHDQLSVRTAFQDLENYRQWATQAFSGFGERNTLNLKTLSDTVGRRAVEE